MTSLTNSLEGGTNGTTLTAGAGGNTGGASGSFFDDVSIGASATLTFDNAHAAHGSLAMKVANGASAVITNAGWSTSLGSALSQVWFRSYFYFTANPASSHGIVRYLITAGGTQSCRFIIQAAGTIQVNDTNNSAITGTTSTTTIPLNAWWRLEGFCIASATVGQVEYKIFTTADSSTPAETKTSAATQNTGTGISQVLCGFAGNGLASETIWCDDMGVTTTGYLGPAGGVSQAGLLLASGMWPP